MDIFIRYFIESEEVLFAKTIRHSTIPIPRLYETVFIGNEKYRVKDVCYGYEYPNEDKILEDEYGMIDITLEEIA